MTKERNPHKHAALIHAWADGAVIQYKGPSDYLWKDTADNFPLWHSNSEYRIKPEPKPDIVWAVHVHKNGQFKFCSPKGNNLRLTFSGETGELISAEVIK